MKIYAKQVPPEYQESPLFIGGCWPENVFIFGNKWLTDHAGRLEDIKQALEDISDVCNGWSNYRKLSDVIPARDDGREYTRPERLQLVRLAKNYTRLPAGHVRRNIGRFHKMYKEYNRGYGITELLKPWDGTTPESWHKYPVEKSPHKLLVNKNGDVFYITGGGSICTWRSRSRLRYHMQRLYQIGVIS